MTIAEVRAGMNINTWIMTGGFVLTLAAILITFGQDRRENQLRHDSNERRIAELEVQTRANALAINAGQISAAVLTSEMAATRREMEALRQALSDVTQFLRAGGLAP